MNNNVYTTIHTHSVRILPKFHWASLWEIGPKYAPQSSNVCSISNSTVHNVSIHTYTFLENKKVTKTENKRDTMTKKEGGSEHTHGWFVRCASR